MRFGEFEVEMPTNGLTNPHCFAFLAPWVNSGNVGKNIFTSISLATGAQKIGGLVEPGKFYDFTRYRPNLRDVDGTREIIMPNTNISVAFTTDENNPNSSDTILLYMLEPHNLAEQFNDSVLQLMQGLGVQNYTLLGSMYNMVPHTRTLPVSGKTFNMELPDELVLAGVRPPQYEGATSSVSAITEQLANKFGMQAMSLIVNLPLYNRVADDHMGKLRLLSLLARIYDWVKISEEDKTKAAETYATIDTAVKQDGTLVNLVEQLEKSYDDNDTKDPSRQFKELAPEFRRFLDKIADQKAEGDTAP